MVSAKVPETVQLTSEAPARGDAPATPEPEAASDEPAEEGGAPGIGTFIGDVRISDTRITYRDAATGAEQVVFVESFEARAASRDPGSTFVNTRRVRLASLGGLSDPPGRLPGRTP